MHIRTETICLFLILLIGSLLLVYSLGDRSLGHDELDTAKFAKNIKTCHFPYNQPCNNNTVFNLSNAPNLFPRLTYYIAYPMFFIPGDFEFNLRLPFVIIGFISIIFFYFLSCEIIQDKKYNLISTLIYTTSVIFLLHARSSRYYTLILLFSIIAYLSWYKSLISKKYRIISIISLSMLFYSHIQIFFYVVVSLIMYYLFKRQIIDALINLIPIIIITLPAIYLWLFKWSIPTRTNMIHFFLNNPYALITSTGLIFFYLFAFFIPPLLIIFFMPEKTPERNYIIFLIISISIFMSLVTHNSLPELRKFTVIILPLSTLFITLSLKRIGKISNILMYVFLNIIIFTNFLNAASLFPIKLIINDLPDVENQDKIPIINSAIKPRLIFFEFIYELNHHYTTDIENILMYKEHLNGKRIYSEIQSDGIWVYIPNNTIVNSASEADIIISKILFNNTHIVSIINISDNMWSDAPDLTRHKFVTNNSDRAYILEKYEE